MKLAIIIISDPKNGEEALGRAFNALGMAAEAQSKGGLCSKLMARVQVQST